jgi:hypothetical protein
MRKDPHALKNSVPQLVQKRRVRAALTLARSTPIRRHAHVSSNYAVTADQRTSIVREARRFKLVADRLPIRSRAAG